MTFLARVSPRATQKADSRDARRPIALVRRAKRPAAARKRPPGPTNKLAIIATNQWPTTPRRRNTRPAKQHHRSSRPARPSKVSPSRRTSRTYATKEVKASNTQDVASLIEASENALHAGLEAMYGDMADSTFKALRRVMPITKLKMKWSVDALRLKGGLTKAAAEAY